MFVYPPWHVQATTTRRVAGVHGRTGTLKKAASIAPSWLDMDATGYLPTWDAARRLESPQSRVEAIIPKPESAERPGRKLASALSGSDWVARASAQWPYATDHY